MINDRLPEVTRVKLCILVPLNRNDNNIKINVTVLNDQTGRL